MELFIDATVQNAMLLTGRVITSVQSTQKSILRGHELRYGTLDVHRVFYYCLESDSKYFLTPQFIFRISVISAL